MRGEGLAAQAAAGTRTGFSAQGKLDAAISRLKEQAAKVGANGILLNTISDEVGGGISFGVGTGSYSGGSGGSVGVGTSSASTYKIVTAVAIYVTDDSMPADTELEAAAEE